MKKMTLSNVQGAYAGESQAHMRYLNFAERARKDGFPNVARLFEAASFSEQIHATNHLKAMEGIQDTAANLVTAAGGEQFEVDDMYPAYMAVADLQGEANASKQMYRALAAEKVHFNLYQKASQNASAGKDIGETAYYICPVCGFTMEGEAPDVCPICGVKHDLFKKF
jgi:rubrerythrin